VHPNIDPSIHAFALRVKASSKPYRPLVSAPSRRRSPPFQTPPLPRKKKTERKRGREKGEREKEKETEEKGGAHRERIEQQEKGENARKKNQWKHVERKMLASTCKGC